MQVKELKKDGLSHALEITLTANDIDGRIDRKLTEVGKTLKVQGFRPGKAPLAIVKKKYGRAVMGEVLEEAVRETSEKAMTDRNLKPALQPKIEVKSFDEGQDLTYTMEVEVMPQFKVAEYKGAKLKKLVAKPTDKDIADALQKIAAGERTTKPVEGKRAAKAGDTVVINFKGRTADDNVAHPGMAMDGHHLELGSGQFIPGFEDQLTGKKAGDTVEVKLDFPADYGARELAGRQAIFDVEITELREPAESKVDDDMAKAIGFEDLAALRAAVVERLQGEFDYHSRLYLKKSLMDFLDDAHDFPVPPGMVEHELGGIVQQIENERGGHAHHDPDHVHDENCNHGEKLSDAEKDDLRAVAERRVRLGLVLSEVGNGNNIKVSNAELRAAAEAEARKFPGQERLIFELFSKNPQAQQGLMARAFEEKVVDYILALAEVKEENVDADTLLKAIESEEEEIKAAKSGKSPDTKKKPAKKKS